MRNVTVALTAMALALSLGQAGAAEKCHIGDAAICLSTPGCHWNYDKRGCYEGEGRKQDACAAHEDPNVCNANKTFNCQWNEAAKTCQTKSG